MEELKKKIELQATEKKKAPKWERVCCNDRLYCIEM